MKSRVVLAIALLLLSIGCGSASDPALDPDADDSVGPETAESLDDGKSDVTELRVRTGVTTLWVDKVTLADHGPGGAPRITIRARTSRDLASVFAWVPDDAFGSASIVSARQLEVVLDEGHEINTLLSGLAIFVTIDTKTGTPSHYTARIQLASRLTGFQGSSKLHPSSVIDPVYVRDEENPLRYRGRIGADQPGTALGVNTDESADPIVTALGASEWQFDWTYDGLALAAFPKGDGVVFEAALSTGTVTKRASFEHRVLRVGLTTKDPATTWPTPGCESAVSSCIQATIGDDLGACGSYREVSRCMSSVLPDASTFAGDFAQHLVGWYAAHGADVAASGGNTLEQAQQAIDLGSVTEVTDSSEDPYGHDLSTTLVFAHPDVVFPGSDNVWYGAYDRNSGELLGIYDFN